MYQNQKQLLASLFEEAYQSCRPAVCMPAYLADIDDSAGLCVLGAGKAAAEMAGVMYQHFGDKCFGAVAVRHGLTENIATGKIKVLEASHPVPDHSSLEAAKTILKLAQDNDKNVPIIFLISGGGSSLISLPIEGISFSDKQSLNKFLLGSGASINEINTVRKQLSQVKGGRLGAATKSQIKTLIISDVVGDDPSLIASGPTIKDLSTPKQALSILKKYDFPEIDKFEKHLSQVAPSNNQEKLTDFSIIANGCTAIDKATGLAKSLKWNTQVIDYHQQGEAKEVALEHAKIALEAKRKGESVILFCGGELTVSLDDSEGRGGPNQEYLLALAIALDGEKGIYALSCDTDGVDGSEDVAGAYIDEKTLERAKSASADPKEYLDEHQSFSFFQKIDDLIITGQTNTNVNDFRAIMIRP